MRIPAARILYFGLDYGAPSSGGCHLSHLVTQHIPCNGNNCDHYSVLNGGTWRRQDWSEDVERWVDALCLSFPARTVLPAVFALSRFCMRQVQLMMYR